MTVKNIVSKSKMKNTSFLIPEKDVNLKHEARHILKRKSDI